MTTTMQLESNDSNAKENKSLSLILATIGQIDPPMLKLPRAAKANTIQWSHDSFIQVPCLDRHKRPQKNQQPNKQNSKTAFNEKGGSE